MAPAVVFASSEQASPVQSMPWLARAVHDRRADRADERERQFGALDAAYSRCGGIASADEVLLRLRACGQAQPLSRLARWIVARQVASLEWHATTWLPRFQFDETMSLRPEVEAVTRELGNVLDEWELVRWFVAPSAWLAGMTPHDALRECPADVHQAARVDRFVALG